MIAVYYCALIIVGILLGPALILFKKKARAGLKEKLGFVDPKTRAALQQEDSPLWIHAVSVGEFNAVWPLIQALKKTYPTLPLVLSTTTLTGQQLAKERAGSLATVIYFPFDLPFAVSSWLDAVRPRAVLIAETEIWPGFYHQCRERRIALVVVNGRISPRSFRGYHRWRLFWKPVLRCITLILAQSPAEVGRYKQISSEVSAVPVGNLKFDGLQAITAEERQSLRQLVGLSSGDQEAEFVIVAGSTHEGEEAPLLKALAQLGPDARLIIAPRHPERFERVVEVVQAHGFRAVRYTRQERMSTKNDVYVLDTIGQLARFYSLAKVAFVGGTLVPIGGHNLAEPCAYGVPVVCGPHTEKARDVATPLKEIEALVAIQSEEQLVACLKDFHHHPDKGRRLGQSGLQWLEGSQGAVNRTMAALQSVPGLLAPIRSAARR